MSNPERSDPERPREDELLAYLDGELDPARQTELRRRLDADWELRADLSRVERRIEKFIQATAHQSPATLPPVDDLWRDFTDRQARRPAAAPAETGHTLFTAFSVRPPRAPHWAWGWRWPRLMGALAGGLLICAALGFLLFRTEQPVSAEALLRQTAQAEAARAGQVAEPVVYRRLQVRRRSAGRESAATWESWRDAQRNQFRQRVGGEKSAPQVVAELERVLQANQLDARRPLSAAAYAAWRARIQKQSEWVTEIILPDQQAGLKLTTVAAAAPAAPAIREASLVVRRADWHAVAQQLQVQSEGGLHEYELSETAYEVLPSQALTVFADLAPTPLVYPIAAPTRRAAVPSPSSKALPTEAALREAEVAALYTLHQAQADLNGQIEIVRAPHGQIVARGLVETAERKEQLTEALRRIPLVTIQLQTIAEATQRTPVASSNTVIPSSEAIGRAPDGNAFQQQLARYFANRAESPPQIQQRIAQLSNTVIAASNAALAEAWALRRLAERFAEDAAPPDAQLRLEEMKRNHLARLKAHSRTLRAQLEPLLSALAGEQGVISNTPPESAPPALLVFKAVEQVRQLTHDLFAGAGRSAPTPQQAARQLLAALARLDAALR